MKTTRTLLFAVGVLAPATTLIAQEGSSPAGDSRMERIFAEGRFHLDLRLRYEFADQQGLDASHAATARTRIGYTTNTDLPLSGLIELEDIRALDGSAYNQAGLNDQPGKTVIADPETTELNQAYLRLRHEGLDARVGRQRIILDNHRFIGNVGWRQNEQTFDAASVSYSPSTDLTLFYGYLDRVNRIFGPDHPMGRWDSDSHLFNARSTLPFLGEGAAYAYLLRLGDAPAMSGDTYGGWVRPAIPGLSAPTTLHLEVARQFDNRTSPAGVDFSHTYFRAELETVIENYTFGGGYEQLGGDGTTAFQTPLATLHAFNGWADLFLVTPDDGLADIYAFASAKLPASFTGRVNLHHFTSDRGNTTFGQEIGVLLSRPLGDRATALAKAAYFDGRNGRPDVTRFWIQTEIRL